MKQPNKKILMVARHNKVEALRMASGLTLLDDIVSVVVCGELEASPAMQEQLEVLEFSEVPLHYTGVSLAELVPHVAAADVVYIV
jgi:hypothetical protein